jgi:cell division protein FtsA
LSDTILAIDIGSTKVSAFVAKVEPNGYVHILGQGIAKSHGIKKGVITNIELASKSVKQAVSDAKRMSGADIYTATVSISNAYAKSIHATGIVNIPHKEIGINEIERAMQTALYNANIPSEYEVIHALPYNFNVDDQEFIEDPFGMNAARMEVDVNIVMTQKSNLSNLKKAIRSAGIDIDSLVLSGYASSIAVLSDEEKEMGAAVIDIGGQTGNLVINFGNSVRYNDFLGVGSNHVTNDISMALHTPIQIAEEVKLHYGIMPIDEHETLELPIMGDEEKTKSVSTEVIHAVMHARVEETLMLLANSLNKSGLAEQLSAGIIFTGGMAKLKGFIELAQQVFYNHAVRIGKPKRVEGLFEEFQDPTFSTVIGLLLYKAGGHTEYEIDFNREMLHSKKSNIEDISDIQLMSTKPKHHKEENKTVENESPAQQEETVTTGNTINLDEFPQAVDEEVNPLTKLSNWVKQLF